MLVNKNSTNEQLMLDATVRAALEAGNCVLIDKQATSNPEYTTLFIAGFVESQPSDSVNAAQAALLGWDQSSFYVARCVQNAKTTVADKFQAGHVFTDFALQINDSNDPQYPDHQPRQSSKGEVYMDESGHKIYRSFMLTTKAELDSQGHKIIKRKAVAKTASVGVAALLAED